MQSGDMQNAPLAKDPPVFGYFIRAQLAHAEIVELDLEAARTAEGVLFVLDAATLAELGPCTNLPTQALNIGGKAGNIPPARPILADEVVRYLGEPVAFIVAQSEAQAIAAAELVDMDLMERPEVHQMVPGGDAIHDSVPGNLAFEYDFGPATETAAALETSVHRVLVDVGQNRPMIVSPRVRGAIADWHEGRFSLQLQGRGIGARAKTLARLLGLAPEAVQISNPDQGDTPSSQAVLPEYICLAVAAQVLARPVCWTAEPPSNERAEHDVLARAEIGFDADFKIKALRVNLVSNLGAYACEDGQSVHTEHFGAAMTGDYDIGLASLGALGVYTNAVPLIGHHGAGRDAAVFTLERLMETAARKLGLDPVDLRNRNLPLGLTTPDRLNRKADGASGIGHAYQPNFSAQTAVRIELQQDGSANLHLAIKDTDGRCAAVLTGVTGIAAEKIHVSAKKPAPHGDDVTEDQITVVAAAVDQLISGLIAFLQCDVGVKEVRFQGHDFTASGSNMRLSLEEAAEWAREKGREDLLDVTSVLKECPQTKTYQVEIEIDSKTGELRVLQSLPAEIAAAVLPYLTVETDEYGSESALLLPNLHDITKRSETDAVAATIAILNAVEDALSRRSMRHVDLPLSPKRVLGWIQEAETGTL